MCGLVGVASKYITAVDMKWFKHAIIADTIRGPHSTGVALCNTKGQSIAKAAVNGPSFVEGKAYDTLSRDAISTLTPASAVIGHNRWATVGSITDDTAHPFQHGNIAGVHNGTLWWHEHLAKGEGNKFDVDSEAVIYALDKSDTFVDVLEDLPGAFALVWHDMSTNKLHFARNDERELYIAESVDGDTILWASEEGMLKWLADRNYERTKFNIYLLPVGELTTYTIDAKNLVDSCEIVKFKPDDSYSTSKYGNWGNYAGGYASYGTQTNSYKKTPQVLKDAKTVKETYGNMKGGGGIVLYKDVPFQIGQRVKATAHNYCYHSKHPEDSYGKMFLKCSYGGSTYNLGCPLQDTRYVKGAEYEVTISNNIIEYDDFTYAVIGVHSAERVDDVVPFLLEHDEDISLSNGTVTKKDWEECLESGCMTCGFDMTGQQPSGCSVDDGVICCEYCTTYLENCV